jgi:hypothetical protein
MHAPLPIDEEPAAAADDAVARVLADACIRDGAGLLDALEVRRNALQLSNATVEGLANLAAGHLTKFAGPARSKSPTLATIDRVMSVLGLSFVLVVDPSKVDRAQPAWRPRAASKVRQRPLSPVTVARARPHVIAELARRAARPRWAGVDARTFLEREASR